MNNRVIEVKELSKAISDKFEVVKNSNISGIYLNGSGLHLNKKR